MWGSMDPDTYLDVTNTFDTKLDALSRHRSQVGQGWELREVRARTRYAEVGEEDWRDLRGGVQADRDFLDGLTG